MNVSVQTLEEDTPQLVEKRYVAVRPFTRIVPNGMVVDEGSLGAKLSATVLLTPMPVEIDDTTSAMCLSHWPTDLIGALRERNWSICLSIGTDKTLLKKVNAQASMLMGAYKSLGKVEDIQQLWKSTFVQGDGNEAESWEAFKNVLKRSNEGKSFRAGEELTEEIEENDEEKDPRDPKRLPKINTNGSIPVDTDSKKPRKVDGIYSQPQGELAIALEFGRVRRMADELKGGIDVQIDFLVEERGDQEAEKLSDIFAAEQDQKSKGTFNAQSNKNDFENDIRESRNIKRTDDFFSLKANFRRGREAYQNAVAQGKGRCEERNKIAKLPVSAETLAINDQKRADCLKSGMAAHAYSSPQMEAADGRLPKKNSPEDEAGQRYAAALSTGALARLYCLAIDVEVFLTVSELQDLADDNSNGAKIGSLSYVHVSATIEHDNCVAKEGDPFQPPCTMTTIETNPASIENSSAFWPVTMEEVYAVKNGCPITDYASQVSGYLVSGEHLDCKDGNCTPRVDLTSLDIRSASEQEIPSSVEKPEFIDGKLKGKVFHTAGLALLDRDIQRDKAKALARRDGKKNDKGVVCWNKGDLIYADDLTLGYRLDVGIPASSDATNTDWRALNLRVVDYGKSGVPPIAKIADKLMPEVAGNYKGEHRMRIDASYLSMPEQLLPKIEGETEKNDNTTPVDLTVSESVVTWTGSPLGIEAMKPPSFARSGQQGNSSFTVSQDALPFGRKISLPKSEQTAVSKIMPPHLRFGWPYRFKLRAVYSGGNSVPVSHLATENELEDQKLSFPLLKGDKPAYFRFLRQRPIDPPVVLMPKHEALKQHGTGNLMGYQENGVATVRSVQSLPGDKADTDRQYTERAFPQETSRIVLPPELAMEDVARHGSFDKPSSDKKGSHPNLVGAFADVSWKKVRGNSGFPVIKTQTIQGFNGVWLPLRPRRAGDIVAPRIASALSNERAREEQAASQGRRRTKTIYKTPIYTREDSDTEDRQPYYPDPFAQKLVISPRFAGSGKRLTEENTVVDIFEVKKEPWKKLAQALPVVLTFRRGSIGLASQGTGLSKKHLKVTKRRVGLTSDGRVQTSLTGSANAIQVIIELPHGSSFEFDLWYATGADTLSGMSALVQSVAISAQLKNKNFTVGLKEQLGDDLVSKALSKKPAYRTGHSIDLVGTGGFTVNPEHIRDVAECLARAQLERPLRDLSAPATVSGVHASNNLTGAIQLVRDRKKRPLMQLHRASYDEFDRRPSDVPAVSKVKTGGEPGPDLPVLLTQAIVIPEQSDFVLEGYIDVDLNRVSGFDIVVRSVNPGSGDFDDPDRRRDLASLRSGQWPLIYDIDGRAYVKTASQTFGFELTQEGKVTFPSADVILFSVRDLPPDAGKGNAAADYIEDKGLTRLALHSLLDKTKKFENTRVVQAHKFTDCLGRELTLEIRPVPRGLGSLSTSDRFLDQADPSKKDSHDVADPFPLEQVLGATEKIQLQLPSAARPAQPAVNGPVHCFKWLTHPPVKGASYTERKPIIRLMFDRPWISAEQDEKLGIVLWPPNQLDQKYLDKDNVATKSGFDNTINKITYKPTPDDEGERQFQLLDFVDEDLGAGGAFVTRLGADPVKEEIYSPRAFLSYKVFKPDTQANARSGETTGWYEAKRKHSLIENALMPVLPVKDGDEQSVGQFMHVALVLFEPRFDPDKEKWYVDVELENHSVFSEPFIRFGVVRYSGRSRPDMRVSQPAVVWATVMPGRKTTTTFNEKTGELDVTVEGRGAKVSIEPMADATGSDFPQIFATVGRESTSEDGTVLRTPVDLRHRDKKNPDYNASDSASGMRRNREERDSSWLLLDASRAGQIEGACWKGKFEIDVQEVAKPGELYLFLEEVEHFRPASYPQQEPVDHKMFLGIEGKPDYQRDVVVETGPRFACRIPLNKR
ncbi:hypothetical protein [Roseibium sp. SCP14]|uniref:hypothetical protein n=1 Tax=Roseibium sp. SCP14 TaxID=3141375 RepID=UPI0033386DEF